MRPEIFSADSISRLLRRRTLATMDELKSALGSSVDMTVFRKLRSIDYISSYSHQGKYYALRRAARFDAHGLWTCRSVHFSQAGSLIDTVERFVAHSERGYFASELATQLLVDVKQPLLSLVRSGRIVREMSGGVFLYCSLDPARHRAQIAARQAGAPAAPPVAGLPPEHLKATIILFLGLLDEKQRRIYAGLESLRLGPRGDALVAQVLGLDPATVTKGRKELEKGEVDTTRLRRPGAGRKPLEKKRRNRAPNPGAPER